ncbi:MAG: CubicO group peptidase (beta-lactamase class C family) [Sphingobacteriales bacterium]|jgi:CubicO group peptidase (beta-lactamase class C family)
MLKKILTIFIAVLIVANIAVLVTGHTYIYKALVYQQPGIDDLELFKTRKVTASENPIDLNVSSTANQKELSQKLTNTLSELESVAFLVWKDDSIIHEQYWDGYSATSSTNPFSSAKSIVGLAIGIAIDKGFIKSLNQPVGDFVEAFKAEGLNTIKIVDVLRMASGTSWEESYSTPFNHTTAAYYGTDLEGLITSLHLDKKAGTEYRYKSGDTQLLQLVLKNASGMPLSDFVSKYVWQPIGASENAFWSLDKKDGNEKAYCCMYSNARDFAKLGIMTMCGGEINGNQVVSQEYLEKALSPINLPDVDGNIVDYYGYQWWLTKLQGMNVFYTRGILGQYIFCIPELNMVVVRLGHKRSEIKVNNHPQDVVVYLEECIKTFSK